MTETSQPGPQLTGDGQSLLSSTAITATTNGTVEAIFPGSISGIAFTCDVTSAGSSSGDLLDMYIQTKIDDTNWLDAVHFAQVAGDSTGIRMMDKIHANGAVTAFASSDALGAGAQRDVLGSRWRARAVITSSTDPTFAASVFAQPM